jgi:hypothetical protein
MTETKNLKRTMHTTLIAKSLALTFAVLGSVSAYAQDTNNSDVNGCEK